MASHRSKSVLIRLRPSERKLLDDLARIEDRTLSELLREPVLARARRVVAAAADDDGESDS